VAAATASQHAALAHRCWR